MSPSRPIGLLCTITRGGFSGERIFSLQLPDGHTQEGIAPREYCWDEQGNPIGLEEPPANESIPGIVAAREYQRRGDRVQVSTPDGEVFTVFSSQVRPRPASSTEPAQNVPIRP
jgi:hypothetical protein